MNAQNNKNRAKDHRPKVISFHQSLDGLDIAAKKSVLWPCHAFNISIPQKKKSALNVFEQTLLKITEIESGDTEKITEVMCIDKELVSFIQNRLNQLGLLNNRYELSDEGKKILDSWRNEAEDNVEYISGYIFLDLHSGKILPYIHLGNLKYEKILSIKEDSIRIEVGTTGKSKKVSCKKISLSKTSHWGKIPDPNRIIRAIREFKRKYKNHALLKQDVVQYPPSVPMAEAITVNQHPELIYLHCQALIQVSNPNLLVTDGCGFGFSESFAKHLNSQGWRWISELKSKGIIDHLNNDELVSEQKKRVSYKYPEISKRVSSSKKSLDTVKRLNVNTTNDERDCQYKIESGIKNLYAALEWTFRQVVSENPVSQWENIFSSGNFKDNEKILIEFAKKVGFIVDKKSQRLLQVKSGAIKQIEHGTVELQPLLALAIAGASSNHPVYRLAENHSGFLNHALELKKYRNSIEHGSSEELSIDENLLTELVDMTVPMIISLIPDVATDLGEDDKLSSVDDSDQERLKADIELDKKLGRPLLLELSSDIKEQLTRSELMLAKFTDEETIEIIKCYASVMQHVLFEVTKDRWLEHESDKIREDAVEKIVQCGFYPTPDSIPKQISKVNAGKLDQTVQGSSQSLGASLLAVFLLGSEDELLELKKSDPTFIDVIANLARLRGHGNKKVSDFSREEIESVKNESLKNSVFKAIKIVTEIF